MEDDAQTMETKRLIDRYIQIDRQIDIVPFYATLLHVIFKHFFDTAKIFTLKSKVQNNENVNYIFVSNYFYIIYKNM